MKFIVLEKKMSNHEFLRKSLRYELDVEPYNFSRENPDVTLAKISYLNYSIVGINNIGSYHIKIRKEIGGENFRKDLDWSNEFKHIQINYN